MVDVASEFLIQDVRCFNGLQSGQLRPITLLVGENNTGKTTFLGCYAALNRLLSQSIHMDSPADFNCAPFCMGSFRNLLRRNYRNGVGDNEFVLGTGIQGKRVEDKRILVTFEERDSQPFVSKVAYFVDGLSLSFSRNKGSDTCVAIDGENIDLLQPCPFSYAFSLYTGRLPVDEDVYGKSTDQVDEFCSKWSDATTKNFGHSNNQIRPLVSYGLSRSRPQHTYDLVDET
ncbi:MAG: hypothetical protein OXC80_09540, partial [Gammaproteobacteria bacterium]|nr:hypothetical protein [Gammaproteobacteria bacterium]